MADLEDMDVTSKLYLETIDLLKKNGVSTERAVASAQDMIDRLHPEKNENKGSGNDSLLTMGKITISGVGNEMYIRSSGYEVDRYPKRMRVGSKIFLIHWYNDEEWEKDPTLGSENKGKTQPESSSVHIRTSIRYDNTPNVEKMYGLQDMAETLIHEALHCMYIESMLDKNPRSKDKWHQEEYTVQVLAPQITGFIQDNPDLVKWIQEARR